jgi:glutathione reductase (NADPH)
MSDKGYDVVILGAGNAGMGVTVPTRDAGLSVAILEHRQLGGTCPNRGCIPKKVLVAAGHALHEINRANAHGIGIGRPLLDWAALIDREKEMISRIPEALARGMADRGVEILRGQAVFVAPDAVKVGNTTVRAKHIVIATGSKPRKLPVAGAEHMITSDDVLSERTLPRDVVFVGGGVIALEFSHVYARAGAKVTILEVLPRLLGQLDADAVAKVRAESERIGIAVKTGVNVKSITKANGRLRVLYEDQGTDSTIEADRVVNGAGRIADVDGLDLDAAKVNHDRGRIAVDAYLRSQSNSSVYVAGDARSGLQLSPVATYEGRIVGRNIVDGAKHKPDYASIPSCVYTVPALASVGLSEEAARERGLKVRIETRDMLGWLSAKTYAESAAWSKIIIEEPGDTIVGVHMVGHGGEELVNLFALAMAHRITAGDLRKLVYAYPTFSADIASML